jgi:hypothetical protein
MTDYDWDEACDLREQLREYAEFEMNSHQEMVEQLCNLSQYPDYMSQELWNAVIDEMKAELKNYKENATIVKTTETYTREIVDIEWND